MTASGEWPVERLLELWSVERGCSVRDAVAELVREEWPHVKVVMARLRAGEVQPVVVGTAGRAVLVDGHHRIAAATLLGLATLPVEDLRGGR